MEVLIGLAIILAVNEWRDHKAKKERKLIEAHVKRLSRQLHFVGDLAEKIEANNKAIHAHRQELAPIYEFLHKAHTDLETMVKEYQVNGVPLGYERAQHFDHVEGL